MSGRLVLEDFPPRRWQPTGRGKAADIARVLSPNGRAHWRVQNAAKQHIHALIWYAAYAASTCGADWPHVAAPARLRLRYVRPVQRDRDQDNWTSGVSKAVIDGLVKAGVLDGDDSTRLQLAPVEIVTEPGRCALELVVEALGGGEPG